MKNTICALFAFGIVATGFVSCQKVKDALFPAFETQVDDIEFTIPIVAGGVETSVSNTFYFNLDSTIKDYTENVFSIRNINSVKVSGLTLMITNTDALHDISNFESIHVAMASNAKTTPVVIVDAAVPNEPANILNLAATNSPDLKDYLKGNQLTYTVTGKARRSTIKPLQATVSISLAIK